MKLVGVETHHLGLVAIGVVAPPEADVLPVELDETVVADGGLVGVAPEIGQHLAGAGERGLGIDHPVVRSKRGLQTFEGAAAVETIAAGHTQLALAMGVGEEVEILPAEDLGESGRWEQESLARGGDPALLVPAQGSAGDDTVDVDVLSQILAPCMQHHGDAELATEPAGIAAELKQGLGRGLEEQPVDESGIALSDGVEVVGQGEDDVQ